MLENIPQGGMVKIRDLYPEVDGKTGFTIGHSDGNPIVVLPDVVNSETYPYTGLVVPRDHAEVIRDANGIVTEERLKENSAKFWRYFNAKQQRFQESCHENDYYKIHPKINPADFAEEQCEGWKCERGVKSSINSCSPADVKDVIEETIEASIEVPLNEETMDRIVKCVVERIAEQLEKQDMAYDPKINVPFLGFTDADTGRQRYYRRDAIVGFGANDFGVYVVFDQNYLPIGVPAVLNVKETVDDICDMLNR
jgi:hypothetical protein